MYKVLQYCLILVLTMSSVFWCNQVSAKSVSERRVVPHYNWADSLIIANETSSKALQLKVKRVENNLSRNGMILVVLVIFLLILLIFQRFNAQQVVKKKNRMIAQYKKMMYTAVCSQEREYRRMADELHNGVGALLSTIKLNISNVNLRMNHSGIQTEMILETRSLIDIAINNVRDISKTLSPATLEVFGLGQALDDLLQKISVETGIETEFVLDKQRNAMSMEVEFSFYRIVRGLLFNAIQHPLPDRIFMELKFKKNRLYLFLQIDAQSIDPVSQQNELRVNNNFDRHNIESRLAMIDGKIEMFDSTEYCHKIILSLPIKIILAA